MTYPMLLWMLSTPFEGFSGSEDSGQTNDGPLVVRASSYQVTRLREIGEPGPWIGKSGRSQSIDDRR